MSAEDDSIRAFEEKLRAHQVQREQRLTADLNELFDGDHRSTSAPVLKGNTVTRENSISALNARVDLTGDAGLRTVDDLFVEAFQLRRYMPGVNLFYPTIYAETLDEFFAPLVEELDLSPQGKAAALARMKTEAEETARKTNGGGILGVNLPGRGCYLNGWLFAYGRRYAPRDALTDPQVLPRIIGTIAHEKLGHGFITEFTALGDEKKRLGLARLDLARRFDVRLADSPTAALLEQKNMVVHSASQLTEEGYASWVETFLMTALGMSAREPHSLETIGRALDQLAARDSKSREPVNHLKQALRVLFAPTPLDYPSLHQAIITLQQLAPALDDIVAREIGQPLRYAVGYLLADKIAANAGWLTVPYAVAIAANLTYDLDKVSVSDLAQLVVSEPRLNVDSRLAMLSAIELENKGDVTALASAAQSALSMTVPSWLKIG